MHVLPRSAVASQALGRAGSRVGLGLAWSLLLALQVQSLGGCSGAEDAAIERQLAGGLIEPRSGSALAGFVTLKKRSGVIKVFLNVLNAPPGDHGVHLHQYGDCTASDASSAGPHWNPENHLHGAPTDTSHLGDLGNLHVDASGRGLLVFSSAAFSMGDGTEFDIVGRALVIKELPDDLTTQPSGNSGLRIGCGVVR